MRPNFIIIHHSLTDDGRTVEWQAIRRYHVQTNGWKDIGYQYGIENVDGVYEVLKGRMDNETGAHCIGYNDRSIGICCVGNFDLYTPVPEVQQLLKRLVLSLMETYQIPVENVLGHWETYSLRGVPIEKSCPGLKFSMVQFREILKGVL